MCETVRLSHSSRPLIYFLRGNCTRNRTGFPSNDRETSVRHSRSFLGETVFTWTRRGWDACFLKSRIRKKKKYWKIFLNVWVFFTVEKSYFKKYILVRGGIFLNNSKLFNFRAYELINTRAFRLSKHRIKERSRRLYINKGNGRSGVQSDYTRSISHLPFGFRLRRTRSSIRDELVAFNREIADRRFAIFFPRGSHCISFHSAACILHNMQMRPLQPNG